MPNPWDIPPFPEQGDDEADWIYRAVGQAMTKWEEVEVELAELYTELIEKPAELQSIRDYGEPFSFSQRADKLEQAARRYFATHPNQAHEAAFDDMLCQVRGWANRRNDIAHGVVQQADFQPRFRDQYMREGKQRYCLFPAFYMHRKHDKDYRPTYCYTCNELEDFSAHFFQARIKAQDVRHLISPP